MSLFAATPPCRSRAGRGRCAAPVADGQAYLEHEPGAGRPGKHTQQRGGLGRRDRHPVLGGVGLHLGDQRVGRLPQRIQVVAGRPFADHAKRLRVRRSSKPMPILWYLNSRSTGRVARPGGHGWSPDATDGQPRPMTRPDDDSEPGARAIARVDLHCHSRFSARSELYLARTFGMRSVFTDPHLVYREAKARGMTHVTLTDHDTIAGALQLADFPDFTIGEEISAFFPTEALHVHVLVWGVDEARHREIGELRFNIFELVEYLRSEGLPHALAHPMSVVSELRAEHYEQLMLLFALWETRNGSSTPIENQISAELVAASACPHPPPRREVRPRTCDRGHPIGRGLRRPRRSRCRRHLHADPPGSRRDRPVRRPAAPQGGAARHARFDGQDRPHGHQPPLSRRRRRLAQLAVTHAGAPRHAFQHPLDGARRAAQPAARRPLRRPGDRPTLAA